MKMTVRAIAIACLFAICLPFASCATANKGDQTSGTSGTNTSTPTSEITVCANGHTASDWSAAVGGVQKKTCTVCGMLLDAKVADDVVAACREGHTAGEWSKTVDGVQRKSCTVCGTLVEVKVVTDDPACANGHTAGEWGAVSAGVQKKHCTVCGTLVDVRAVVDAPACANGHTAGEWGAVSAGVQKKHCTVCATLVDVRAVANVPACEDGHTAGEWGSTANGVQKKHCTVCGIIVDVRAVVDAPACANGHTAGEWGAVSAGVQKKHCTVCGTLVDVKAVTNVPACEGGHTAGNWEAAVEGVQKKHCSVCGTLVDVKAVVDDPACANGHTAGEWGAVSAGVQKKHCTVCGTLVDVKAVTVDPACANGHTAGAWGAVSAGVQKKHCIVCDTLTDVRVVVDELSCTDGHTAGEWGETEDGVKKKHCTVCATLLDVKAVIEDPACTDGHTAGEWSETEDGVQKKYCSVCATLIDVKAVVEDPACADGHTPGEWSETVDGVQKKHCTVCGTIVDVKVVIEDPACADGHTAGAWGETVDGVQKKHCTVCGTLVDVKTVVDALLCAEGHTAGEWTPVSTETSCVGTVAQKLCTVCSVVVDVKLIPGTGHVLSETEEPAITEPTCTEPGRSDAICTLCDMVIYGVEIPALGHVWSAWEITASPTLTVKGEQKRTCGRCEETEWAEYDPYENEGYAKHDPFSLDYDNEKITVMYWSDVENLEFEVEAVTGDNVSDAIFERNRLIESRLNVDLEWNGVRGNVNSRVNFVKQVQSYAEAGVGGADIIATYSMTAGTLAVQGLLTDLGAIENSYIDLTQPWWPRGVAESLSFGGEQSDPYYFLTGDISTNAIHMMHCLYLNKTMLEDLDGDISDVYQMVRNGSWTLDALIELTTGVYSDLDGDEVKSKDDRFGLVGRSYVLDAFYTGAGMRYLQAGDSAVNALTISPDYTSLTTKLLVQKLGTVFGTDDWITEKFGNEPDYDASLRDITVFCDGRALAMQQHLTMAEKTLVGKVAFDYALLPMPKYSANQTSYYTSLGNPVTLYGLFAGMDTRGDMGATLSMMSAVLECWAAEGYTLTTPAVFEENMACDLSEDEDQAAMLEYVRAGITVDLGRIFATDLAQMSTRVGYCISSNTSWEEFYGTYEPTLEEELAALIGTYQTAKES